MMSLTFGLFTQVSDSGPQTQVSASGPQGPLVLPPLEGLCCRGKKFIKVASDFTP